MHDNDGYIGALAVHCWCTIGTLTVKHRHIIDTASECYPYTVGTLLVHFWRAISKLSVHYQYNRNDASKLSVNCEYTIDTLLVLSEQWW